MEPENMSHAQPPTTQQPTARLKHPPRPQKQNWNVIVTVKDDALNEARRILKKHGRVAKTEFFNVLSMQVDDLGDFLHDIAEELKADLIAQHAIARVLPLERTFSFQSREEFESYAKDAVADWIDRLEQKKFHVRMHRRGFKYRLSSQEEERFLDHSIIETLQTRGQTASVNFDDPDVIIDLESVGSRAGLAYWTREDLNRYPFLHLD